MNLTVRILTKIICADIDGTLIVKGTDISEENRKALNRLLNDDYLVGLASGRQISAVDKNWKQWGLDRDFDFYIGMNGAMFKDNITGQMEDSSLMNIDQVKRIVDHLKPLELSTSYYCEDDVNYLWGVDEEMRMSVMRNPNYKYQEIDSFKPLENIRTYRVMFRVSEDKMEMVQEYVKAHPFDEEFEGFRTHPLCYEVMLKGVSKGKAIERYCHNKDIAFDDVYAFGDTSNDVEMLKMCHGVCMCDGTEDAKIVSEYITEYPCAESGFARFVNSYFYDQKE